MTTKKKEKISADEVWDLSCSLENWLLPRLIKFRKMKRYTVPDENMTPEQWNAELDEIIWALRDSDNEEMKLARKYNLQMHHGPDRGGYSRVHLTMTDKKEYRRLAKALYKRSEAARALLQKRLYQLWD